MFERILLFPKPIWKGYVNAEKRKYISFITLKSDYTISKETKPSEVKK